MKRLMVLPTRIPAATGTRFMVWGNEYRVHGITDRLLFVNGDQRFRLVLTATGEGQFEGTYRRDDQLGVRHMVQHPLARGEGGGEQENFAWHFAPLPFAWEARVNSGDSRECWPQELVHAGRVPCWHCFHPISSEFPDKNGLHCDNVHCPQISTRQLGWERVAATNGEIPDDAINAWRLVLNIGDRSAG